MLSPIAFEQQQKLKLQGIGQTRGYSHHSAPFGFNLCTLAMIARMPHGNSSCPLQEKVVVCLVALPQLAATGRSNKDHRTLPLDQDDASGVGPDAVL